MQQTEFISFEVSIEAKKYYDPKLYAYLQSMIIMDLVKLKRFELTYPKIVDFLPEPIDKDAWNLEKQDLLP